MTDKILLCLIGLIFLVIVALIVLSALGYGDNLNTPDEIKPEEKKKFFWMKWLKSLESFNYLSSNSSTWFYY